MKTGINGIAALSAVAIIGAAANAGIVIVDDFSSGEFDISTRSASGNIIDPLAGVLGAEREVSWDIVSNPFNSRLSLFAAFEGGSGLGIDMGSGNASIVTLSYDGLGSGAMAAGLGYDAVAEGTQSVRLTFLSLDLDLDVTVTLTDGSGNIASLNRVLTGGTAGPEFFAFNSFATDPGFDFSSVAGLDVAFNLGGQQPNRDLFLQNIVFDTQVPGPGSLSLLAIGGVMAFRRNRRG
jgi:hypothetical protein